MNGGTEEVPMATEKLLATYGNTDASSSKQQKPEATKIESGNLDPNLTLHCYYLSSPSPYQFGVVSGGQKL